MEHAAGIFLVVADAPELHVEEGRLELDHLAVVSERGASECAVLGVADFESDGAVACAALVEVFAHVGVHLVVFPVRFAGPDRSLGGEAAGQLGEDAPTFDEGVLRYAPDRDAVAVAKDEIVVELILEDFWDVSAKHEAGETLQDTGVLGFAEAGPDNADRVRGVAANTYAGPPRAEGTFDVDRAAAALGPVVEVPAEFACIHAGVQLAVRELQGCGGAFLPCPLEVEFSKG